MPTLTFQTTTDPDLSHRWEELNSQIQANALVGNRTDDDELRARADARHTELLAEREKVEEQIADAARIITVHRLSPRAWGPLTVQHPPRPDDPYDTAVGFNTDTFDTALMEACATVTDGHGNEVDWDWPSLVDTMSPGLYEQIITAVLRLHMDRDAVPFSLADWQARHSSGQRSKQPGPQASPDQSS